MENTVFERVKKSSKHLALLSDEVRREVLCAVADAIDSHHRELLAANAADLSRMDRPNPLYDRLLLTPDRLTAIAADMRRVSALPDPLHRVLLERTMPNGLHLQRISVPFGVIGLIYEARPNVTFDVFSLCFKSGNACILKGGKDADSSNRAAVALIHEVLRSRGIGPDVVALLPATHASTTALLHATGYVDLVIPRGSSRLIRLVRQEAQVPCIETGAGVVNAFFDEAGDKETGRRVVDNSKTRRVSVCNALDCLLIHRQRLSDLPYICSTLGEKGVEILADDEAFAALEHGYPEHLLKHASAESWGTEFMAMRMALRTVSDLDGALDHIARFGSGHSETIITENADTARRFREEVDAACVYVNTPTSFTDGGQFGMGAEIGISTQKLGARGPMGLEEITTYKWIITGHGQIRP